MDQRFVKGKKAEEIFERACKELISENGLAGFERHDISGTDFILFFDGPGPLRIEIKSSYNGELFHNIKHDTRTLVVPIRKKKISKRRTRKLVKRTKNRIAEMNESPCQAPR